MHGICDDAHMTYVYPMISDLCILSSRRLWVDGDLAGGLVRVSTSLSCPVCHTCSVVFWICTSMHFHGLVVLFSVDPLGSRCFVISCLGYLCQVASCLFSDWRGAGVSGRLSLHLRRRHPLGMLCGRFCHLGDSESLSCTLPLTFLAFGVSAPFICSPFVTFSIQPLLLRIASNRQVKIDEIPAPASKFATSFKGLGLNPLCKIV